MDDPADDLPHWLREQEARWREYRAKKAKKATFQTLLEVWPEAPVPQGTEKLTDLTVAQARELLWQMHTHALLFRVLAEDLELLGLFSGQQRKYLPPWYAEDSAEGFTGKIPHPPGVN